MKAQFKLNNSISIETNYFDVDVIGDIYFISTSINKYNSNLGFEKEFSNTMLGSISYADVKNPLRLLLFHEDFNQIIILDNNLNTIGDPIELDELGFLNCKLACNSNLGGFWIYDHSLGQLFCLNNNLEVINQSIDINTIRDYYGLPNYLLEYNQKVFLNFPDEGVVIFDNYGGFIKEIPISSRRELSIDAENLYLYSNDSLFTYHLSSNNIVKKKLPKNQLIEGLKVCNDKLYIFTKNSFLIYEILN